MRILGLAFAASVLTALPAQAQDAAAGENRLQHLVLRGGIQLESFWLAWLDEALGEAVEGAVEEGRE